jgi:hypothetical protein
LGFFNDKDKGVFLRAKREPDGRGTFKLVEGEPLQIRQLLPDKR